MCCAMGTKYHCFHPSKVDDAEREIEVMRPKMNRQLTFTTEPINEAVLVAQRKLTGGMGAVVYFTGVVRGIEGGTGISALEYESFQKMAEHQFGLLFDEVEKQWPVESVRLV